MKSIFVFDLRRGNLQVHYGSTARSLLLRITKSILMLHVLTDLFSAFRWIPFNWTHSWRTLLR